jgi:hypothetical protein
MAKIIRSEKSGKQMVYQEMLGQVLITFKKMANKWQKMAKKWLKMVKNGKLLSK